MYYLVLRVQRPERKPVLIALRNHLYPCRTQKLSWAAPKILGWRRPGKIGRCWRFIYLKIIRISLKIKYSRIAQSVERLTVNQDVVGSSPTVGARESRWWKSPAFLFALTNLWFVYSLTVNQDGVGEWAEIIQSLSQLRWQLSLPKRALHRGLFTSY